VFWVNGFTGFVASQFLISVENELAFLRGSQALISGPRADPMPALGIAQGQTSS
jgi:hypothetical protein